MRNDLARRLFTLVLIVCLLWLTVLCAFGKTLMRLNAEIRHPRQNESIFLEHRADGVIYIGGEGELHGDDMMALIEGEGNKNDVTDLIIGDGITSLGFNAMCQFESLRTLWLGRDMKSVSNGAIRECTSLMYVFVPQGLSLAGKDFLYSCNNCTVVTDGNVKKLPKMKNVSRKNVLGNVDSYEAMVAACGEGVTLPEALKQWWQ